MRLAQMRIYIDEFKQMIFDQEEQLSSPLQPGLIKSNEGMSELASEVIELKQALLHGKWYSSLDDEKKWPKAFLRLAHP